MIVTVIVASKNHGVHDLNVCILLCEKNKKIKKICWISNFRFISKIILENEKAKSKENNKIYPYTENTNTE